MPIRPVRLSAALLLFVFGIATSQTHTPQSFWLDIVRGPLSGPDAEDKFVKTYKYASLPSGIAPYLEGSVVSVVRTTDGARKVFLSMERNETADAALLLDGRDWILTREPEKGAIVHFLGVAQDFTKEPFLITFEPEAIDGLYIETTVPDPRLRRR